MQEPWATCVKVMLEQFGFRYVLAQGVGDFDLFIEVFKNRVSQFYKKTWYDGTRNIRHIRMN